MTKTEKMTFSVDPNWREIAKYDIEAHEALVRAYEEGKKEEKD